MISIKNSVLVFVLVLGFTTVVRAQPLENTPRDRAYDREVIVEKEIIPYDHIREADVMWEKRIWRVIDFKEKMNLPFAYPQQPFIETIIDKLKQNEISAFSPLDDDFQQIYTYDQIMQKLSSVDTVIDYDPDTYEEIVRIVNNEFNPLSVKKLRLKEDWIFDEETSTLVVRIIGLAPVRDRIDETTGEYIGEEVMFWVYYPDLRPILVHYEVFNDRNDAVRMSWEDVFEMRLFNSYIIKESNVYDRYIENYSAGIDAVLESERIKREIFQFEHELWEF